VSPVDGVGFRPRSLLPVRVVLWKETFPLRVRQSPAEGNPPTGLDSPQTSLRQTGEPEGFLSMQNLKSARKDKETGFLAPRKNLILLRYIFSKNQTYYQTYYRTTI
jgi:hypothetical protein